MNNERKEKLTLQIMDYMREEELEIKDFNDDAENYTAETGITNLSNMLCHIATNIDIDYKSTSDERWTEISCYLPFPNGKSYTVILYLTYDGFKFEKAEEIAEMIMEYEELSETLFIKN